MFSPFRIARPSKTPTSKTTHPVITTTRAQRLAKKNAKPKKQATDDKIEPKYMSYVACSVLSYGLSTVIFFFNFIFYILRYRLRSFFLKAKREREES